MAIARAGQQGLSLLAALVLARFLPPHAYGLLGMAVVVISFINVFKDWGTSAALIQRKDLTDDLICSVFWANCVFGVVATAVAAGIAPAVAAFYVEPQVTLVIVALSTSCLFAGLSNAQKALLTRAMSFKVLARIELASSAAAATAAVVFASLGAGVWSLVALTLMNTAAAALLQWLVSPWRPKWHLSWTEMRSIAPYSLNLSGSDIVTYFSLNADNILVGRFLGATALGFYTMAYTLMLYPIQNISWVLGRVLFPVLSQLQDDTAQFRQMYLRVCGFIAAITFPLMLGLLVTAEPLIAAVLGPTWRPIVPLVMIMAPVGMVQSVGTTVGHIYTAKGRTDWMFRWGLVSGALVLISFAVGLRWGILGVAASYGVVTFGLLYPGFAIPFRLIQLPVREFVQALWPQLKYSSSMAVVVILFRLGMWWLGISEPWLVATGAVLLGTATYIALMLWRNPPVVQSLRKLAPDVPIPFFSPSGSRVRL